MLCVNKLMTPARLSGANTTEEKRQAPDGLSAPASASGARPEVKTINETPISREAKEPASNSSSLSSRQLKRRLKRLHTMHARLTHEVANMNAEVRELFRKQPERQVMLQAMETRHAMAEQQDKASPTTQTSTTLEPTTVERLTADELIHMRELRKCFDLGNCVYKRLRDLRQRHHNELAEVSSKIVELSQVQATQQAQEAKDEQQDQRISGNTQASSSSSSVGACEEVQTIMRPDPRELKRLHSMHVRLTRELANMNATVAELCRKQQKRLDKLQAMDRRQAMAEEEAKADQEAEHVCNDTQASPAPAAPFSAPETRTKRLTTDELSYVQDLKKCFDMGISAHQCLQDSRARHECELAEVTSKMVELARVQPKRKATQQCQGEEQPKPKLERLTELEMIQDRHEVDMELINSECIRAIVESATSTASTVTPGVSAPVTPWSCAANMDLPSDYSDDDNDDDSDNVEEEKKMQTLPDEACGAMEYNPLFAPVVDPARLPCTGNGDQCTCVCTHKAEHCPCWTCEKERFQVWWPKTCDAFGKLCLDRDYQAAESICRQMLKSITKPGSGKLNFRHQTQLRYPDEWHVKEFRHDVASSSEIYTAVWHLAIVMVRPAYADPRSLTKERLLEARELLDWLNERSHGETDRKGDLLASLERAADFVNRRLRKEHCVGAEEYDDTVSSKIRRGLRFVFDRMFARPKIR